jgi:hypothetical protein
LNGVDHANKPSSWVLEPRQDGPAMPEDIQHWTEVYGELTAFLRHLLKTARPGPQSAELQSRLDFYDERLTWWVERRNGWSLMPDEETGDPS